MLTIYTQTEFDLQAMYGQSLINVQGKTCVQRFMMFVFDCIHTAKVDHFIILVFLITTAIEDEKTLE